MFSRLSVSPQGDLVLQNRVDRTLGRETLSGIMTAVPCSVLISKYVPFININQMLSILSKLDEARFFFL